MGKKKESVLKDFKHLNGGVIQLLDGAAEIMKEVQSGWTLIGRNKTIYIETDKEIDLTDVEGITLMGGGKPRYEVEPDFTFRKNYILTKSINAVEEEKAAE